MRGLWCLTTKQRQSKELETMKRTRRIELTLAISLLTAAWLAPRAAADVTLPAIFSDHMVLQADATVPVWGWAEPGQEVEVAFAGQKKTAKADEAGKWVVTLEALKANAEAADLPAAPVSLENSFVS